MTTAGETLILTPYEAGKESLLNELYRIICFTQGAARQSFLLAPFSSTKAAAHQHPLQCSPPNLGISGERLETSRMGMGSMFEEWPYASCYPREPGAWWAFEVNILLVLSGVQECVRMSGTGWNAVMSTKTVQGETCMLLRVNWHLMKTKCKNMHNTYYADNNMM